MNAAFQSARLIQSANGDRSKLEQLVRDLTRDLSRMKGENVTDGDSMFLALGDASVRVEYGMETDSDGEQTGEVRPICAFINDRWVTISDDLFSTAQVDRWCEEIKSALVEDGQALDAKGTPWFLKRSAV